MMNFSPNTPKRPRGENIVPMINVVFLLLIFFLMSAQIAPPDPFDIDIPQSTAETVPEARDTLYLSHEGALSFDGIIGADVWSAIEGRDNTVPLLIRADAQTKAVDIAKLLPQLAQAGVTETRLVTGGR